MRRRGWAWARLLGAAVVLGVLVQRLGTGPFLDGVRGLGPGTLLAATAIGALVTLCSAWRWQVVTGALGVGVSLRTATAAYYRSQFLNSTLPGGVLGDVHRGVRHGIDAGDLGRGVRGVVWERVAGQVVQGTAALVVLLTLPSPVHAAMPLVATAVVLTGVLLLIAAPRLGRRVRGRPGRVLRTAAVDVGEALLHPSTWPAVLLASLLAVAGHVGMFLLAARAAGVHGSLPSLLPLTLLVLIGAAIPLNVGGWGPREGVAAWVFAAAGWGAAAGTAAATAFGVLTLVSTLPGGVVLVVGWRRRARGQDRADADVRPVAPALQGAAREDPVAHG